MQMLKVYKAIHIVMQRFHEMDVFDVGIFKACLVSFGILVGTYATRLCRKLAPLVWVAFIGSYILLIYRLFIAPCIRKE